jgi:phosphoribosylformylglycinamidine cyclo-ligase
MSKGLEAKQSRYRAAGVDPALAGGLIRGLMKDAAAAGPLPNDYFCQLVALPAGLATPGSWLAIGTDGVGTKLLLGKQTGLLGGIGQDLVGMVYNDLITCGGQPFAFLDYYATGRIEPEDYATVIRSIREACAACAMPLLGGETAEMPGLYEAGDFDLAGFGVAAVREDELLSPARTAVGDVLVGFTSSGFHSNGYSLIRKVLADGGLDLHAPHTFGGRSRALKEWCMEPTRLYVDVIRAIRNRSIEVVSLAHITGGGYFENLPRSLADDCGAVLRSAVFDAPHCELFAWFAETAGMTRPEMLATFNAGYGLVAVCRPAAVAAVRAQFPDATVLGEVVERQPERVALV